MGFKTGRFDVFTFKVTERFMVESLVDDSIDHRNDVMGAQFLFLSSWALFSVKDIKKPGK